MTFRATLAVAFGTALLAPGAHAQDRVLAEFFEFLRIPNTAATPDQLSKNAEWLISALQRRGVAARLLNVPGAVPAVYGELRNPKATQTVMVYAHYDGQPVAPAMWQGSGPFEPSLRGGNPADPEARVYARGASDDKGAILAMLTALDRMRAAGQVPAVNLKFLFEGEEESGSRNLEKILQVHKGALQSDFWLICDGPVHQTRKMQVYFGARGVTGFNITVYGPKRELHSGHYGNWAPNPAMNLARLVGSMKDDSGKVLVETFYDSTEPLSATEIAALKAEPPVDEALERELLISRTENAPRRLSELINSPSLNVRGIQSADIGAEARNVIPERATASFDLRLVKGNDPAAMVEKVRAHIRANGYFIVEGRDPTETERLTSPKVLRFDLTEPGYRAVRTSMDLPCSRQVVAALERAHGPIVKLPTLGGSVPLAIIEDVMGVPMIGIPIANHDNNQHSHNENLRLQNLRDGIKTFQALFAM